MANIMLDLETLATTPNAHILSIGAVMFDEESVGRIFYTPIDVASDQCGAEIDPKTVKWWTEQEEAAMSAFSEDGVSFHRALDLFGYFVRDAGYDVCVWGNGADFDNLILSSAYARAGIPLPWNRFRNRCYRTLSSLFPDTPRSISRVEHNALDDAISQAQHAMQLLKRIKGGQTDDA